jgi:type I restriction enzyme R subunit
MANEAHARIKINKLLEEAGWRFFDSKEGTANILLENHVKITQKEVDAWSNDYEKVESGYYSLLTDWNWKTKHGKPHNFKMHLIYLLLKK